MYRALGALVVSASLLAGTVALLATPPAALAVFPAFSKLCEDNDLNGFDLAFGETITCQTEDIHDRAFVKQYRHTKDTAEVSIIEPGGSTDAVFNVYCGFTFDAKDNPIRTRGARLTYTLPKGANHTVRISCRGQ